jgi:hypothetical protein
MRQCLTVALAAFIMGLSGLVPFGACSSPSPGPEAKAAIIDQLYDVQPNKAFVSEVTQQLNALGLEVDIYRSNEVTVDFYQKLPRHGYKLIIFRVHSGLLVKEGEMAEGTWLFTSEPHSPVKYTEQRLAGSIVKARTDEHHPWVFAIGSDFVIQNMEGQFDNAFIIMMGCFSLRLDDLAQAFVKKGVNTCLGWNGNLSLDYVDKATIKLMNNLCHEEMTIKRAIREVMADMGPSPVYNAELVCHPAQNSYSTINTIIR